MRARRTVPAELEGERLDRAVAILFDLSRTRARELADAGALYLDGRRTRRLSLAVRAGVTLELEETPRAPVTRAPAVPAATLVAYRDERLLVAVKPAGMATTATRQGVRGTLEEALRRELRAATGPRAARRLYLTAVHRLDRDASGLVLWALDRDAAARLSSALATHAIEREYVCVVAGRVANDEGTIDRAIAPLPGGRRVRVLAPGEVSPEAREARTRYAVTARLPLSTLLAVRLETGRMHQIRAHLQAIGHPIVGDRLYGGRRAARLALHAAHLRLAHPWSGEAIDLAPPWPADLVALVAALAAEA